LQAQTPLPCNIRPHKRSLIPYKTSLSMLFSGTTT
jgi:hypothetical protein